MLRSFLVHDSTAFSFLYLVTDCKLLPALVSTLEKVNWARNMVRIFVLFDA